MLKQKSKKTTPTSLKYPVMNPEYESRNLKGRIVFIVIYSSLHILQKLKSANILKMP